jgi:hypothetical protein|nr:MAG TPA_asm: hypothetical protein [Caudoviricetes sp.]
MACIKKLERNLTFDCAKAAEPTSIRGVEELILVNYSDISSYSVDVTGLATITMNTGKKGYVFTSVNNSVSVSIAARINDAILTAEEHTVVIKLIDNSGSIGVSELAGIINALRVGTFVACVMTTSGNRVVYGLLSGLECSEIVGDSTTDGLITITLKTPDSAGGDRMLAITEGTYNGLKTPRA